MTDTPRVGGRQWAALVVLAAALALDVSSVALINAALPAIGSAFGISGSLLQWTMTAYALTFAGFLLLGGRMADVLGRRRIFVIGVAVFVVASAVAALAPGVLVLVLARGVQGIGAALSGPAALALLTDIFPEGPERNRALGVYAAVGASSFSVGLVLGGVFTEFLGWRSLFVVTVVAGIAVLVAVRPTLPAGDGEGGRSLDLPGGVLITGGMLLLVLGVTAGGESGWSSPVTIVEIVAAVALIAGFVVRERRTAEPLLPLSIFRAVPVRSATLTGVAFYTAVNGLLFFAPLYMQDMLGYSALQSGLAVLPMGITVIVTSNLAGRLLSRVGQRPLIVAGLLLIAVGVSLWAFTPEAGSYWAYMFPGIVIMSAGQGTAFGAMTGAALTGLPQHQHGVAGAVNVSSQQVGSSVGVAVLVTVSTALGEGLTGYHAAYLVAGAIALVTAVYIGAVGRWSTDPAASSEPDTDSTPAVATG